MKAFVPLLGRGAKRRLFKGKGWLTLKAAKSAGRKSEIVLVGTEKPDCRSRTSDRRSTPYFIGAELVILEGLVLKMFPRVIITLLHLPLKFGGMESSPCRAVLLDYLPGSD